MPLATTTEIKTKDAALAAISQVLDSIVEILMISGISITDACQLMRECAVRVAARELRTEIGNESKSRVAVITGLSRSEVARLWNTGKQKSSKRPGRQSRLQRIIDAWLDSPAYLNKAGEPDPIPIFGRRRSFEQLVKSHGGGIPVRAMLDELLNIDVVEIDDTQQLHLKSRVAIQKGIRANSLNSFGIRASDLLNTLAYNLANESPHFEGSTFICDIDPKLLPLIRREVGNRGSTFISSIDELLNATARRPKIANSKSNYGGRRAGVGVFYFEERPSLDRSHIAKLASRKNLKRATKQSKTSK